MEQTKGFERENENSNERLVYESKKSFPSLKQSGQNWNKRFRVFANGPGDLGSIPGRVIPKTLKMELDKHLA